MPTANKKKRLEKKAAVTLVLTGLFSKKEAGHHVAAGTRHVHSSTLGARDACARITQRELESETPSQYPWERAQEATLFELRSSAGRMELIKKISSQACLAAKRDLREKVELLLEELLTNSIYHSYRAKDGSEKYARKDSVILTESEVVKVRFHHSPAGLYLSVSDQGGSLRFEDLAQSFKRCYGDQTKQIEMKSGGAGLGMYMMFEVATHLKLVTSNSSTLVSVWLADKSTFDPDTFSFNFFERR